MEGDTICYTCKKVIRGKILTALDNSYHPEHFVCGKCQQPIISDKFQQHDGQPYCDKDYTEMFCKKCHACGKPIKDKIIKALDHDWHEEHFVCTICKNTLVGQAFYEKNGKPFCKKDYNMNFADKCMGCGQPITEKAIIALNGKWHPDCFKCIKCENPVVEDTFQVENGMPICSKCA